MIKSFQFENFKSFQEASLDIEKLTILIGTNASGKTNAIEGIKILSEIATGRELAMVLDGSKNIDSGIRGGSRGCCRFSTTHFKLGCIVDLDDETDLHYSIKIKVGDRIIVEEESLYRVWQNIKNKDDLLFKTKRASKESGDIKVEFNNGKSGKNPDTLCIRSMSILSQIISKLPNQTEKTKGLIESIDLVINNLRHILFLDPVPSQMRDYSRIGDVQLRPQADNLSSVLYHLSQDNHNKQAILDMIATLPENDIKDIDFVKTNIGDVMFQLKESYGDKEEAIEAKRLSDGTIRCMAVIAALISEKAGNIVIIEEVDNGIHPSRANSLIKHIAKLAEERKIDVIITTHNPALLNAVQGDNLYGVSICYRSKEDKSSKIISFIDIEKYPSLLAQGGLGDLATNDTITKVLKEENKLTKDYSWLEV